MHRLCPKTIARILSSVALMTLLAPCWAQGRIGTVFVRVSLDHADWTYKPGELVKCKINVIQDGQPVPNAQVTYSFGPEMMPPTTEKTVAVPADGLTIEAGTMKEPGFLRCIAITEMNGRRYRGLATAGFAPEQIKPTTTDPSDFDAFWNTGKEALAKIPLDAKMTLLPELCTANVNVYHVNLQNISGDSNAAPSRLYGILAEPKAPGLYTWGFNDETCPPTSMYSSYNIITAKKELLLALETGHNTVPEQVERVNNWIVNAVKTGQ